MLRWRLTRLRPGPVFFVLAAAVLAGAPAAAQQPQLVAPVGADEAADFDLYFPLRDRAAAEALVYEQTRERSPQYHRWLTPPEFLQRFGPAAATVAGVAAELDRIGMTVGGLNGQRLHLRAKAAAVETGFGVRLWHGRFADGTETLTADRPLALPPALARSGALIPQFTALPPKHAYAHLLDGAGAVLQGPVGPYFTANLRQAYDLPGATAADGSGATIGILMSNDVQPTDITDYFAMEGAANFAPSLSVIPIDGGAKFGPSASGETTLDIQQSAGMALNANVILYNLRNLSDPVILAGLSRIVSDNQVDVVNMSFGGAETHTTSAVVQAYHALFIQGSAQGITFVASSGDNGAALDPARPSTTTADHPATDPFVTAVGGTNLITTLTKANPDSSYVSENANPDPQSPSGCMSVSLPDGCIWGSTGGNSIFFTRPGYQKLVPTGSTTARTVPDVAGHMGGCFANDPAFVQPCGADRSHDFIVIAGKLTQEIGTSASAPGFAGMVAIAVTVGRSRLGALNPFLYKAAKKQRQGGPAVFHHRGIQGNNGIYTVKAPYDRVIGNGTVDARQLFGMTGLPAAGAPGSSDNP